MALLLLVGDVHGKINVLLERIENYDSSYHIFQIGDMGLGFFGVNLPEQKQNFQFIRGNHDDPKACREHPNYLGDFGYLKELKLFYMGGAYSIDYKWRQASMQRGAAPLWWADEELSNEELNEALELYKKSKPEIVITHECPSSLAQELLQSLGLIVKPEKLECENSRTAKMLNVMFQVHKPKLWVFGHYHIDKTIEREGTIFRCIGELSTYELEVR